jgi:hypothetical protein
VVPEVAQLIVVLVSFSKLVELRAKMMRNAIFLIVFVFYVPKM